MLTKKIENEKVIYDLGFKFAPAIWVAADTDSYAALEAAINNAIDPYYKGVAPEAAFALTEAESIKALEAQL